MKRDWHGYNSKVLNEINWGVFKVYSPRPVLFEDIEFFIKLFFIHIWFSSKPSLCVKVGKFYIIGNKRTFPFK